VTSVPRASLVMVVEDDPAIAQMVSLQLELSGYRTHVERDGLAALEAIRTCDPDVMFLEWDLPVLDGMEVIRIVRSPGVFPRPNLPIVMLTTRSNRSQVVQALRAGVHEFLLKPTSPKALRDRLTSILLKPRPMLKLGEFYVPQPRRIAAPPADQADGEYVASDAVSAE
jgi:two-component system chemotaxis response regulator CheY